MTAEALIVAAGAGMGVDSGLPDFRGTEGFWKAYPPCAARGLDFASMANPHWFLDDPHFAWGFYGHRLNLYRQTKPHDGYRLLSDWAAAMPSGCFVFTSNVDGHFQASGFDVHRVMEVHGSIHFLQCISECGQCAFPADTIEVQVDEASLRARAPLPACPACASLVRPNVLMFGDAAWDQTRADQQEARLRRWLDDARAARMVVIECGAGTAIPTVRRFAESVVAQFDATLIRINVREPEVPRGQIGLQLGALDGLRRICDRMHR